MVSGFNGLLPWDGRRLPFVNVDAITEIGLAILGKRAVPMGGEIPQPQVAIPGEDSPVVVRRDQNSFIGIARGRGNRIEESDLQRRRGKWRRRCLAGRDLQI